MLIIQIGPRESHKIMVLGKGWDYKSISCWMIGTTHMDGTGRWGAKQLVENMEGDTVVEDDGGNINLMQDKESYMQLVEG